MGSNLRLASAGDDIKLWNCDGFVLEKQLNPHGSNISSICWSHDNSVLTSASTAGDKIVMTYPDRSDFTYAVAEGQKVTCVAFNSTSRYVMGGSSTGVVYIWDLKSKSLKKAYQDHKEAVTTVQFNWGDTVLASGSESGEILLYNIVSGIASSPLVGAKGQAVRRVQYSHFRKSLLGSCSDSGGVYLFDANKRTLLNSFTNSHLAPATSLAFSPLNEMLLMSVGLDKRIVCYDVHGKAAVQTMIADSPLTSVDLLHDGVTLAVGSTRGKIYIYDLRKSAEPTRTLSAHKSSIQGLCFQRKTDKSNDGTSSKHTSASRQKNHSVPVASNNILLKTHTSTTKMNGSHEPHSDYYPDKNTLLQTSPASLQAHNVHQQIEEDVFSPIREKLSFNRSNNNSLLKMATTPKAFTDGTGDARNSHGGKNSSINSYADGMFSPVASANSSGKSSLGLSTGMALTSSLPRQQPIGGASETASFPVHDNECYDVTTIPSAGGASLSSHYAGGSDAASVSVPVHRLRAATPENTHQPFNTYKNDDLDSNSDHRSSLSPPSRLQPELPVSRSPRHHHKRSLPSHPKKLPVTSGPSSSPKSRSSAITSSLVTPPDAAPSQPAGAEVGYQLQPFHTEFIRHLIDEALDDFRDQVRQDVLNLHMEMLKQFQIQQEEMRSMLEQYSLNGHLLEEVERLREENKRLKKTF